MDSRETRQGPKAVKKYRDVIRMTLFGRHDKNINDATSIYQGYDRYATTTTGGGVNSLSVTNIGTIGFTASPNLLFQMLHIQILLHLLLPYPILILYLHQLVH